MIWKYRTNTLLHLLSCLGAEGLIKATKKKESQLVKMLRTTNCGFPVLTQVSATHPLHLRLRKHPRTGHIRTERVTEPGCLLQDVFYATGKVYLWNHNNAVANKTRAETCQRQLRYQDKWENSHKSPLPVMDTQRLLREEDFSIEQTSCCIKRYNIFEVFSHLIFNENYRSVMSQDFFQKYNMAKLGIDLMSQDEVTFLVWNGVVGREGKLLELNPYS